MLGFLNVILLQSNHRYVSGHSCGHLQGGDNKNNNEITICRNRSTVKNHVIFALTCRWSLYNKLTFINSSVRAAGFKDFCTWRNVWRTEISKFRHFVNMDMWQFGVLVNLFVFGATAPPPSVGQGLLIHEVSRSHTTTHHTR